MNSTSMCRPLFLFGILMAPLLACSIGCQQKSEALMDPAAAKELCTRLWTDHVETVKTL